MKILITTQYLLHGKGFSFPTLAKIDMEEEEVDEALPLTVAGVERSEVYEAEGAEQYVKNPVSRLALLVEISGRGDLVVVSVL